MIKERKKLKDVKDSVVDTTKDVADKTKDTVDQSEKTLQNQPIKNMKKESLKQTRIDKVIH